VLDDGETLESPRVFDALGASIAVTYHFLYETADALDDLPAARSGGARSKRSRAHGTWPCTSATARADRMEKPF
jgi:hypothetical protein